MQPSVTAYFQFCSHINSATKLSHKQSRSPFGFNTRCFTLFYLTHKQSSQLYADIMTSVTCNCHTLKDFTNIWLYNEIIICNFSLDNWTIGWTMGTWAHSIILKTSILYCKFKLHFYSSFVYLPHCPHPPNILACYGSVIRLWE